MSAEEVEIRILPPKGCLFLNRKGSYVLDILYMTHCNPILSDIIYGSCGTYVLDHLAADAAGLTGGQVAVVALLQVHADFLGSLHFETVHSLTSLGNIDLVIVLHNDTPLSFFGGKFRRNHSFAESAEKTHSFFRKIAQNLENMNALSMGYVGAGALDSPRAISDRPYNTK